jgi:hypothetical protein
MKFIVDTNLQALNALRSALQILGAATARLGESDAGDAEFRAAASLIAQRVSYVERVSKTVPSDDGPVSPTLRKQVDLAISQARDALSTVDRIQGASWATELDDAFSEVMGKVGSGLGQVTTAVGEGTGSLLGGILGGLSPTLLVILGVAAAILIYVNFFKRA